MCKVYTGYCGTSEIEHSLCACTVDNPLAKARGLSLRTNAQTMLHLSLKQTRATLAGDINSLHLLVINLVSGHVHISDCEITLAQSRSLSQFTDISK